MTYNQIIQLFENIAEDHHQINDFGFGPLFNINGEIKPGLRYHCLWAVPLDSVTTEQTKQRRFLLLMLGLVEKDLSNRNEVWSDCERELDDVVKILRKESDDYELVNDPQLFPVTEVTGDWVTGWQTEVVIQTGLNSNYCDIPMDNFSLSGTPSVTLDELGTGTGGTVTVTGNNRRGLIKIITGDTPDVSSLLFTFLFENLTLSIAPTVALSSGIEGSSEILEQVTVTGTRTGFTASLDPNYILSPFTQYYFNYTITR